MAYEIPGLRVGTLTATADYSSAVAQFKCVKAASATTCTIQTASTGPVLGILQNTPASGSAADVMLFGISKAAVTPSDTIAVGDKLKCSTAGGVNASTAAALYILGRAMEAISAATGTITVFLNHQGAGADSTASSVLAAADA